MVKKSWSLTTILENKMVDVRQAKLFHRISFKLLYLWFRTTSIFYRFRNSISILPGQLKQHHLLFKRVEPYLSFRETNAQH